jgi:DNA replication licensing factor MCM6
MSISGDGLAGMKQGDLIIWYVEQQNAKGAYSSTAEVKEEVKCIKAIIEVILLQWYTSFQT